MPASQALLETCSDMVLQCSEGAAIPCIRFYCIASCDVIRNLVEDVVLQKDDKGRCIVPFPNVSRTDLATAVEVIHGVRSVSKLSAASAPAALRGLRALGHTGMNTQIMQKLWSLVKDCGFPHIQPHINELLHTDVVRLDVLRRLVVLCPVWSVFSAKVLGEVCMDLRLAHWLLVLLSRAFPAGPLFRRVLDKLPLAVLDAQAALSLFTAPANASAYHPSEAVDVLGALVRRFETAKWDAPLLGFMRALLTSMQVFDIAPHVAVPLHGTIVMLERTPAVSVLLVVGERRNVCMRKVAPWLSLSVSWVAGTVDARIILDKLDDPGRFPPSCQVRLTAYEAARSTEVWYAVDHVHPAVPIQLQTHGRCSAGCPQSFAAVMRSQGVSRLRVDLFYADHSVLEKAFF